MINSVNVKMGRIEDYSDQERWSQMFEPSPRYPHIAILHTASGSHPLSLRIAGRFTSRLRGLMLAPRLASNEGLLLCKCSSIHSAFMHQTIDVVYLDRNDKVVRCVHRLKPWRASMARGAAQVLEMAVGSIVRYQIAQGDHLQR